MIGDSTYRKDIDGLRAISIIAVILFHLKLITNGYLGVDIFFVISGYLITKQIYTQTLVGEFSIISFFERRIRRIVPLVLFTSFLALILGMFTMLPDDLENLSQSVIATNFFSNNILLLLTSENYWKLVNDYKPLMHTWSLGIEEQFYIIYPLIFIIFKKSSLRILKVSLVFLALSSFVLFIVIDKSAYKFFLLPFRYFELAAGGISYILFSQKRFSSNVKWVSLLGLLFIVFFDFKLVNEVKILIIVISSLGILFSQDDSGLSKLLENRVMVCIGKLSFSLYMWHQIVLAFYRYLYSSEIVILSIISFFVIIIFLSVFSYRFIEVPFRDKDRIPTRYFFSAIILMLFVSTFISLAIYTRAGIIRDVPELDIKSASIKKNFNILNVRDNPHINYNSRIYKLDKNFKTQKIRILIIGDSFARDWANVLLESSYKDKIEISYIVKLITHPEANIRINNSDVIFFSPILKEDFEPLRKQYQIPLNKLWIIGTKNFGSNNGVFYNQKGKLNYCFQRTKVEAKYVEENMILKKQWGNRYIDLLGSTMDTDGLMPVFTPDCKFISQDGMHFTENGAKYFAKVLSINKYIRKKINPK
ncbi:acyltransferase family protein [Pedobacter glucosidilyticus]|uniref:acyltransferase family protein n=1 Tax=Pedobacter glucosidilyticus TaxID=1122941 RepID=UPI0003FB6E04|nr:acyltransferase [Pedobacter glucosidilyticus]